MSFGNPRQPSTFSVGGMADSELSQQLALYKPVATIRDMKQVYFYAGLNAGICWVHPLRFLNPKNPATGLVWDWGEITGTTPADPFPKFVANPWYLPIGTERKMDISGIVNDLLDVRVPKDKYVLEINLVECNIETDPTNWVSIPDFVFVQSVDSDGLPTAVETKATFVRRVLYSPPSTTPATLGQQTFTNAYQEAPKVSTPETLFVRIKELCNNEPYNWTVTNTGQYTLDKSHQLLVRHGDINYANLTLEFGHLVFTGRDLEQEALEDNFVDPIKGATGFRRPVDPPLPLPSPVLQQNARKWDFKYLDYNSEAFNAVGISKATVSNYDAPNTCIDAYYINEYKTGYYAQRPTPTGREMSIQPANRPPFIVSPDQTLGGIKPDAAEGVILAQGTPLKSNQQAKAITFRFMVRVIHTF
jgi:hypothetical protein